MLIYNAMINRCVSQTNVVLVSVEYLAHFCVRHFLDISENKMHYDYVRVVRIFWGKGHKIGCYGICQD